MKNFIFPLILISAIGCKNDGAKYEVHTEKVLPEFRTLTSNEAVKTLKYSDDSEFKASVRTINAKKKPDFNYDSFWNNLSNERIVDKLSLENINYLLSLRDENCLSYNLSSYINFLNIEASRNKNEKSALFLKEQNNFLRKCNQMMSFDSLVESINIHLEKIKTSSNTEELITNLRLLTEYSLERLSNKEEENLKSDINLNLLNEVSLTLKANNNLKAIVLYSQFLNLINDLNIQSILNSNLNELVASDQNMTTILNNFGTNETLNLITANSDQLYSQFSPLRDINKDVKELSSKLIKDMTQSSLRDDWKVINKYAKLIDATVKKENLENALISFNKTVKALEQKLLKSNQANEFFRIHAPTNILAKWLELRVYNFSNKKHQENLIDIRNYALNDSTIFSIIQKRVELYNASNDEFAKIKSEYCNLLNENGIKIKKYSKVSDIEDLLKDENKTGCITLNSGKLENINLNLNKLNADSDLVLTLNNSNLTLDEKVIDINFIDLSITLEQEKIPYQATPHNYNAMVIPFVFQVKKNEFQTLNFIYFYDYNEVQDGPAYNPETIIKDGYDGGNLTLQTKNRKIFYPNFYSEGGRGQSTDTPRAGGKGLDIDLNAFELMTAQDDNFAVDWISEDFNEIRETIKNIDANDERVRFLNYLGVLGQLNSVAMRNAYDKVTNNLAIVAQGEGNCINSYLNGCLFEEFKIKAFNKLKSELLVFEGDLFQKVTSRRTIEDADSGPLPTSGNKGKDGKLEVLTNL